MAEETTNNNYEGIRYKLDWPLIGALAAGVLAYQVVSRSMHMDSPIKPNEVLTLEQMTSEREAVNMHTKEVRRLFPENRDAYLKFTGFKPELAKQYIEDLDHQIAILSEDGKIKDYKRNLALSEERNKLGENIGTFVGLGVPFAYLLSAIGLARYKNYRENKGKKDQNS